MSNSEIAAKAAADLFGRGETGEWWTEQEVALRVEAAIAEAKKSHNEESMRLWAAIISLLAAAIFAQCVIGWIFDLLPSLISLLNL